MTYFFFAVYLVIFSMILYGLTEKKIISVNSSTAVSAFLLKVALGCLYGYIFLNYYHGDDTWRYHAQSKAETVLLKTDPITFFTELFNPKENKYSLLFESLGSYWKELEYVLLIKLIAIFNLFSGGEYYINVIFFSFVTFWGVYFFFILMTTVFRGYGLVMKLLFFYFIPFVFWTSGIRKDGLILLFLSLILFHFYTYITTGTKRRLFLALLFLVLLFTIRSFLTFTLLPALLAWFIADRKKWNPVKTFLLVYGICIVAFFLSATWGPVDLPRKVSNRQQEFMKLEGGSELLLDTLGTNPLSYIKILPQAINHVVLRPYPAEQSSILYKFSSIETYFFIAILFLLVVFPSAEININLSRPFIIALIFYALTNYLLIGYTIPFIGAILRYRIIFETILLSVMIPCIDWKRLLPKFIFK